MLPDCTITVAICTYNRYDVLPKAIESVLAQSLPKSEFHIIVIDNSPKNEKALEFRDKYHGLENIHYHIEPICGLSNARNVAAKMCKSEFIAYLDDDAIASRDWLSSILKAFNKYGDKLAVVAGRVLPIWVKPRPAWLPDAALGALSVVDWGGGLRLMKDGEWGAGANYAIRVQALLDVGGFDTSLGRKGSNKILMSNEEAQVTNLLKDAGYKVAYAPEACVDHMVDPSRITRGWLRKRMAWQAVSDIFEAPDDVFDDMDSTWEGLLAFMAELPPHLRTVRGLFTAIKDPDLTHEQIGAYYNVIILLLGGFELDGKN